MATTPQDGEQSRHRVLVICNDSDYFLRHRLPVVTQLSSLGADVIVVAGGNPIPQNLIQRWKFIHVPIQRFGFDLISDMALMFRTAQIVWSFKPDAIHLITLKPAIFSGLASLFSHFFLGCPKRILITLPGLGRMLSLPRRPRARRYPVGTKLTIAALRILAKHHYVHFTFETRHDLEFWVKSCVVNNTNSSVLDGAGVDPKLFYPSRTPRSNLKTKVIFASRLLKSKGLESFLLMARDLADHPDLQFIVAGIADHEDPDAIRPEDLAKIREIQFLGQIEDMPPLLRECDIVCLPTTYGEGIPRILIEAAATGLASIVSDHPGCREVVEDGITGRVLSGTSNIELSHEMSAAVVNYVNDPDLLNKHKQAAYRHFRSRKFSEDISVAEFTKLLGIASRSSDLPDGARADRSVELSARI